MKQNNLLHICSEFFPLLKTGGLADVTGSLPSAQQETGYQVRLLMPGFPVLKKQVSDLKPVISLDTFAGPVTLLLGHYQTLPIYLIDAPELYFREGNPYYDEDCIDYPDNYLRFALLGWIGCELAKGLDKDWRPDIVHAHDWHAGLACAYLAANNYPAHCVFTIHNLAYQGLFPKSHLAQLQLPESFFQIEGLEFYDQISYLKAGIYYAEHITTVSPSYAREICSPELGYGLEGLLQHRMNQGRLTGILNAIDEKIWDPATDSNLSLHYQSKNLANKKRNKALLQTKFKLLVDEKQLLFVAVSRITEQKGLDLLLPLLPSLLEQGGQFILLGQGNHHLESEFAELALRYPNKMKVLFHYDENLAHHIIAAGDVIMVPSRFEPCGLTQLYGLRYGCLPLVRATGGLADTIIDCSLENLANHSANGFVFQQPNSHELKQAIQRAFALWQKPKVWQTIQRQNMQQHRNWKIAANEYHLIYQHLSLRSR